MTLERQLRFWLGALAGFVVFLWLFKGVLLPFVAGIALAYLLDPIADRMERWGLSRGLAALTIVLAIFVALVVGLILVVPLLGHQLAGLLDRLDHMLSYHSMYGTWERLGEKLTPAEVFTRNFWFCAVEDQSSFVQRDRIGVDNIMLEADYPHCDSTWPHTQATIHEEIGTLPADAIRKITWENASRLYQHPVPESVQSDPESF